MKTLLLFCLMIASTVQLFAQETVTDSIRLKTKIAIADAKHFKLDKRNWKVYRKYRIVYTSDYFKPNTINSTHSEWFTDSVYVKAFREAAYKRNFQRSLIRHYVVAGVKQEIIVTIGIGAILYLIIYAVSHPS